MASYYLTEKRSKRTFEQFQLSLFGTSCFSSDCRKMDRYGTKTYPGLQPIYSQNFLCRAALSAVCGVLLGVIISLIVNCTLLEISLNAFFATYFGLLFSAVGIIILWRIWHQGREADQKATPGGDAYAKNRGAYGYGYGGNKDETDKRRRLHLNIFGGLILLSGFMCFMLEKDWYFHLSPFQKVPLYSILGISVSFALTFSVIDFVNWMVGLVQGNTIARPIVESPNQIYVVLTLAFVMGSIFGCIFGLMQIADSQAYTIRLRLMRMEWYCYHIGGFLGAIGGVANEYLRHIEVQYSPVSLEFDDDI